MLTLEYVDGFSLNQFIEVQAEVKIKGNQLARHIADSFVKQFFEYGFFHADPHPGNIFILKDGKILFLDFGLVGFLDDTLTSLGAAMFLSLIQKDIENLVTLLVKMENRYDEKKDSQDSTNIVRVNNLRKDLNILVLQWSNTGQAGQFTKLLADLLKVAASNGINVPVDFSMLAKAIVTLDVVVKRLDPDFDIAEWEKPMVEKIISRKLKGKHLQSRVKNIGMVLEDLFKKLPDSTATIVENIEKGRFGMEVDPRQLIEYEKLLDTNSKVNSYGTVLAAIIIASALIYQAQNQPHFFGFSLAQIGLYGSLVLVLLFLISNKKKGK